MLPDEGYVKYQAHWTPSDVLQDVPDSLVNMRNTLHVLGWIGVLPDGIGFGNISARATGNLFYISGTQTGHIAVAGKAMFCLVTETRIQENSLFCKGPVQASSEAMTHAAFYAADQSIRAVIHVHLEQLWRYLLERVPVIEATIPYGTPALATAMQRVAEKTPQGLVVTAGHADGIFSYGKDMATAFKMLKQAYDAWSTNKG